jgi:[NiFe] hydrogenase diaphorase moiety small subunit
MKVENNSTELMDLRRSIIEALFVEGNHFCPTCEKSGNCELQALSYRFEIFAPRFPYLFPIRNVDAANGKIIMEHNRCILCKRCVRGIKTKDGKSIFAFHKRGHMTEINVDHDLVMKMTDEEAQKAMDICPVGAILKKGKGFEVPIGKRKYDKTPIGN